MQENNAKRLWSNLHNLHNQIKSNNQVKSHSLRSFGIWKLRSFGIWKLSAGVLFRRKSLFNWRTFAGKRYKVRTGKRKKKFMYKICNPKRNCMPSPQWSAIDSTITGEATGYHSEPQKANQTSRKEMHEKNSSGSISECSLGIPSAWLHVHIEPSNHLSGINNIQNGRAWS